MVHAGIHFANYVGIDYSRTAVEIGKPIYGSKIKLLQADARKPPFNNSSKDFVFSINMLEHIPEPQLALDELIRVTRPGGLVYLDLSYNCRIYTVKKLQYRKYSELVFLDRIEKLLIPLLNNFLFERFLLYRDVFSRNIDADQ